MAWRARALSLTVWRTPCAVEEIDLVYLYREPKGNPHLFKWSRPQRPPANGLQKSSQRRVAHNASGAEASARHQAVSASARPRR